MTELNLKRTKGSHIGYLMVLALLASCGRGWKGELTKERELFVVPQESEIFSAPEMDIEIRQWDFVLDKLDIPHVVFYDSFQGALSYSTLSHDRKWDSETVDPVDKGTGVLAGVSPNIFLVDEKLHIVYLSSSIRDKVPKFYIIKEAVRDPVLNVWRCRIVKRWKSPISLLKAGYIRDINKIGLVFLDSTEKKLMVGVFSPAKDHELERCSTPRSEDEETERSDIRMTSVYWFGQGDLRLKHELDKICNTIHGKVGYSLDMIPTFSRRMERFFGISLYDPAINQAFWIEFKQTDVLSWFGSHEEQHELKREDRKEISLHKVTHASRGEENQCVQRSSAMYGFELSRPVEEITKVQYKNSRGTWKETSFFLSSPRNVFIHVPADPAYPVEISVTYKPAFETRIYSIGTARKNMSVSADKDGNIHIADFVYIPPLMAIEYGIIAIDESGNLRSMFEIVDGGGEGIYTQGTGGTAIAVRADGIPILAYFSPFTSDLRITIPVKNTWISVPKLTGAITGVNPKMLLTRTQDIAVLLSPMMHAGRKSLVIIFVPISL